MMYFIIVHMHIIILALCSIIMWILVWKKRSQRVRPYLIASAIALTLALAIATSIGHS
jgi:hypothetical protein